MTYKLDVGFGKDSNDGWCKFVAKVKLLMTNGILGVKTSVVNNMDKILDEHDAVNLLGTQYIEFETEEDAIAFKLKYL